MSGQKPKEQGIRREGNFAPGKRKSICKGSEARQGRFITVEVPKKQRNKQKTKDITFYLCVSSVVSDSL